MASIAEAKVPRDDDEATNAASPVVSASTPPPSPRRVFLEQSADALGRAWAENWRDELHREGRAAAGGWPGTLREARTRVGATLQHEMRTRKMPVLTEEERELAARLAYASARAEWRRHVDPETE